MRFCRNLLVLLVGLLGPRAFAQWTNVPAANFSAIHLIQFGDQELEVPYYLYHFAQVANAVVETGTNRGFLDIKVNREPVDNQPYNARIMEMQMVLAYFYCASRPWNPYYGNAAVRVRLEAMLDRWTRIQNQPGSADGDYDGLFSEYSWSNWSLAPTGFGSLAAAQVLHLLKVSGLPFDAAILEAGRVSLRRALMALYTRADMRGAARQYSNQFSGSYQAALIYLELWPDPELDAALVAAVTASMAQDQSPAGYWYEQGGPDFGYSGVHESNLRIALPRLRTRSDIFPLMVAADNEWSLWLAANYVPQPGLSTRTFLLNAGIETRTSNSTQTPSSRPWSEFSEASRIFSYTGTEYSAYLVARRSQVQAQFGTWGALAVPSSSSYTPGFVHGAVSNLNVWQPTAAQRAAADALLACNSPVSFNRQYRDPLPLSITTVKRPQYYACVNTDKVRISRQGYGLGLLWNPVFGVALQSVAGTLTNNNWIFGTKRAGMTSTYETATISAAFTAGGASVTPVSGVTTLASGDVGITYPLTTGGTNYGQKTITLDDLQVTVSLTHSGDFTESLPLAHATDVVVTSAVNRVEFRRPNGSWLRLEVLSPGATITVGGTSSLTTGLVRRVVTLSSNGSLTYRLRLSDGVINLQALADSAATGGATPRFVDVLANDLAVNGIPTLAKVTAPGHGTATLVNQQVWYVPAAGFSGGDAFSYVINNGAFSATGAVSMAVGGPTLAVGPAQVSSSTNDGNVAANTVDGNLGTRWSALGDPQWIQFDLLSTQRVDAVSNAFSSGASRVSYFDLLLSGDGANWSTNLTGQSSGTTTNFERFSIAPCWARFVRYRGHGNSQGGWNSLTEVLIHAGTNAAPVAVADVATTRAGLPVVINILGNDSDPDRGPQALGLTTVETPTAGTATVVPGGIRYQPNSGFSGVDTFGYVISDSGVAATGRVTVTVTNIPNLPPVLAAVGNRTIIGGSWLVVTNRATDPDAPAQRLRFSLLTAPVGAVINATNGQVTWRPTVAQSGSSNRFTVVVTEDGWQTNLAAVADGYVRDGTYSNANYGTDTGLSVKLSGGTGLNRESFLRFPAPTDFGEVTQARLRLMPRAVSLPGVHALALVTNDNWAELTLTWSNRPASRPLITSWLPVLGQPVEADVTQVTREAQAGDGWLSLRLFATNTTADGLVNYYSREGSVSEGPCLELTRLPSYALSATQSFWVLVVAPQVPLVSLSPAGNGAFKLLVSGDAGPDYSVQAATSLDQPVDWTTLMTTNSPTLPMQWADPETNVQTQRFYRVLLGP